MARERILSGAVIKYVYEKGELKDILYKQLDLEKSWEDFNIQHELTDKGIVRFAEDWNNLIY